jgi:hypothetical protein
MWQNTFWEDDPGGEPLTYLCRLRTCANKIVTIAYNAKVFVLALYSEQRDIIKMSGRAD